MTTTTPTTVVGIFAEPAEAAAAIRALRQAGFARDDIALASRRWHEAFRDVRVDLQEAATEGAAVGAAVGAIAGGGVGAAAGLAGAALIPGAGVLLGPLASALLGGATGAAVGTFAGPFIAMGLSQAEAETHARHIETGKTVVIVRAGERRDEARAILVEHGAYDESMSNEP